MVRVTCIVWKPICSLLIRLFFEANVNLSFIREHKMLSKVYMTHCFGPVACFMNSLVMPSGPQALLFFNLLMLFYSSCTVNILLRSRLGGGAVNNGCVYVVGVLREETFDFSPSSLSLPGVR